ncbi:hypothetical protein G3M48_007218 [Beauveria asiatica]|uniref:Uncharacterized protein n=1 Tax=Beauveria asiatica TaxID=1069075 RepID=A0AAW0S4X1_9HYPO
MAKLQPVLTIEEMEQQLGYKLDAKSEYLEASSLLYSDLTLFVADLYQRTLREYEMFEKRPNRCHKAVPATIPANCQEKVISSENDSITLRRSNLTGLYQYVADVQDNSGLAIRFLLTAEESLAVAAVTELERTGTEATISQVQKHDSALLSLPVEIRQHIYKHVLGNRCCQ